MAGRARRVLEGTNRKSIAMKFVTQHPRVHLNRSSQMLPLPEEGVDRERINYRQKGRKTFLSNISRCGLSVILGMLFPIPLFGS
jgi:hypothetical protein